MFRNRTQDSNLFLTVYCILSTVHWKSAPSHKIRSDGAPRLILIIKIGFNQNLKQFISVNMPNEPARVVKRRYICRVFGQNIPHQLINRIVALLLESIIYRGEDFLHFVFSVLMHRKRHSLVQHNFINPSFTTFFRINNTNSPVIIIHNFAEKNNSICKF